MLEVEAATMDYRIRGASLIPRRLRALEGVSLTVPEGASVGIVGESGSGKSTLARIICGLTVPTAGRILLDGDPLRLRTRSDRERWWRAVQIVFQDPYLSLNPAMTIGDIVAEPMVMWHGRSWRDARGEARNRLERVGLDPGLASVTSAVLSGGQRQRVSIARALAVSPRLMVLDESVSALDVSVQAQILTLLDDLRRTEELTYVFISHDISVIRLISEQVLVMHEGRVVERCGVEDLTPDRVTHDYTRRLLEAVPRPIGTSSDAR